MQVDETCVQCGVTFAPAESREPSPVLPGPRHIPRGAWVKHSETCLKAIVRAAEQRGMDAAAKVCEDMANEHRWQVETGAGQLESVRRIACEFAASNIRKAAIEAVAEAVCKGSSPSPAAERPATEEETGSPCRVCHGEGHVWRKGSERVKCAWCRGTGCEPAPSPSAPQPIYYQTARDAEIGGPTSEVRPATPQPAVSEDDAPFTYATPKRTYKAKFKVAVSEERVREIVREEVDDLDDVTDELLKRIEAIEKRVDARAGRF